MPVFKFAYSIFAPLSATGIIICLEAIEIVSAQPIYKYIRGLPIDWKHYDADRLDAR